MLWQPYAVPRIKVGLATWKKCILTPLLSLSLRIKDICDISFLPHNYKRSREISFNAFSSYSLFITDTRQYVFCLQRAESLILKVIQIHVRICVKKFLEYSCILVSSIFQQWHFYNGSDVINDFQVIKNSSSNENLNKCTEFSTILFNV